MSKRTSQREYYRKKAHVIVGEHKHALKAVSCILRGLDYFERNPEHNDECLGCENCKEVLDDINMFVEHRLLCSTYRCNICSIWMNTIRVHIGLRIYDIYELRYMTNYFNEISYAIEFGKKQLFKFLMSIGCKCDRTCANTAALIGDLETVEYLHGLGIECCSYGAYCAERNNHYDIVSFLKWRGIEPDLDLDSEYESIGQRDSEESIGFGFRLKR